MLFNRSWNLLSRFQTAFSYCAERLNLNIPTGDGKHCTYRKHDNETQKENAENYQTHCEYNNELHCGIYCVMLPTISFSLHHLLNCVLKNVYNDNFLHTYAVSVLHYKLNIIKYDLM